MGRSRCTVPASTRSDTPAIASLRCELVPVRGSTPSAPTSANHSEGDVAFSAYSAAADAETRSRISSPRAHVLLLTTAVAEKPGQLSSRPAACISL